MFFDSHCHLTDGRFDPDRAEVLARAREGGVTRLVCVASDPDDAARAAELVGEEEGVWRTAGLHPHAAAEHSADTLARVRELVETDPAVVAVGECGLDYHYMNAPREAQLRAFEEQLELAAQLDRPLVVHSRDADDDMAAILANGGSRVRGVLHCFTGGADLLQTALDVGWYVSFSGIVSFRGFAAGGLVRSVPRDRLLIETDSPYLAPAPLRGRRNEPAFVRHVAEAVAALRDEPVEEIARLTTDNAMAFYALEG